MFDLNKFISKYVTNRALSFFQDDMRKNSDQLSKSIKNNSVLVIGGAGTIGSSFIKALICFEPKSLTVVDINENGLTELTRDLRSTYNIKMPFEYITYPLSYSDPIFLKMFNERKGFDIIANFSAHKHVRSEKDKFSIEALINNNIICAKNLLETLETSPPKHFFCVSTDKATNPVNIMGASKKIMEDIIMTYSDKFKVTTARFANVAFSNGSLPDGFLKRISKKQPLTAPKDITRYFVSPEESGQICLLACIIGKSGDIYFPKLKKDQVMNFSEMADNLLKVLDFDIEECKSEESAKSKSKYMKNNNYPVYYSDSDTTGEKEFEEFYTKDEEIRLNRHTSLGVIINSKKRSIDDINNLIKRFQKSFINEDCDKESIVNIIKNYLDNFNHVEKGKSLDSKM